MTHRRWRISPSWVLSCVLIAMFATILVVAGFADARGGNDAAGAHPPVGTDSVPPSVRDGGPWVDATHTPVTSEGLPKGTIALTFDDGPDPVWTPQVLAILKKYDIPATFFVVGSNVTRYPDIVRAVHDAGSELGVHTFSHPDLVNVSRWRLDRELAETQLAIAGSAGVTTYMLRPPYSSSAEAIDDLGYATVLAAAQDGYVSVFTTDDSEDWQRPGIPAILRNATPPADATTGSVVLMHDAGGDRAETVAALDQYIPLMKKKGYRFTTVTGGLGRAPADVAATQHDRTMGGVLLGTLSVATGIVSALSWVLLVVGVLVALRLLLMILAAGRQAKRRRSPDWTWGPPVDWPVSVIVPAYNEIKNIEATVRSILANNYPLEVVVVDDGSSDGTADLVESLGLDRVRVIRQANAGKPVALNRGVRAALHEIVIMIDGDTIFEPDTVRLLVQPFADPSVGAVAGNVKIANRDELIGRLQHIEYVVGFNIDRRVQDALGSIATIPGAAGAFRRHALLDVGGLSTDTLAEDTDVTIALGRAGWRVVFEDRARAWTEAPATASQLWRQRFRWSYGTMQAIWKHRHAVREGGSAGQLGRRGLAHVAVFHILLPITAPLVDIFFVYGLIFEDAAVTLILWTSMLLVQLGGALYAFRMEGESPGALWVLPVQQLMYRQLMYLVLIQSITSAVTGARVRWQRMHRVGVLNDMMPTVSPAAPVRQKAAPRKPTAPSGPPHRERWLDVLRVLSLSQILAYQVTGAGWTTVTFPGLGMLFAVGGSLMVLSAHHIPLIDVIGHRLRRLLVPLWVYGAVLVPLMLARGWAGATDDNTLYWANLLYWVFPFFDPPGSTWAADLTGGLWLIRAGLWFVLFSPLMIGAFRRRPMLAPLAPLGVLVVAAVLGWDQTGGGGLGAAVIDFCTFATCWMLGVAHRDGTLRRMKPAATVGLVLGAVALGGAWTWFHPSTNGSYDLTGIPVGQALISAGAVLLLLRFSPELAWLDRIPVLGRLVTVINARLITIYLTCTVAMAVAPTVDDALGRNSTESVVATAAALTVVAVLALGWVEDLAARRPLQLLPGGRRAKRPEPKRNPFDVPPLEELTSALPARAAATALAVPAAQPAPARAGVHVPAPRQAPIRPVQVPAPRPEARPGPPARRIPSARPAWASGPGPADPTRRVEPVGRTALPDVMTAPPARHRPGNGPLREPVPPAGSNAGPLRRPPSGPQSRPSPAPQPGGPIRTGPPIEPSPPIRTDPPGGRVPARPVREAPGAGPHAAPAPGTGATSPARAPGEPRHGTPTPPARRGRHAVPDEDTRIGPDAAG